MYIFDNGEFIQHLHIIDKAPQHVYVVMLCTLIRCVFFLYIRSKSVLYKTRNACNAIQIFPQKCIILNQFKFPVHGKYLKNHNTIIWKCCLQRKREHSWYSKLYQLVVVELYTKFSENFQKFVKPKLTSRSQKTNKISSKKCLIYLTYPQ